MNLILPSFQNMVKHGSRRITMYGSFPVQSTSEEKGCHALNFINKLEVDTVITTGLLPLQYSNKPLACNKYIANIIAVQLFFFLADQRRFLR